MHLSTMTERQELRKYQVIFFSTGHLPTWGAHPPVSSLCPSSSFRASPGHTGVVCHSILQWVSLSELSTIPCPSWVVPHGLAQSFVELYKLCHDQAVIHEEAQKRQCWFIMHCNSKLKKKNCFNQLIVKEISPEYSLEGLMLKLKLQSFATWCKELTHWERPWCWERLKAGREGDVRGWDG